MEGHSTRQSPRQVVAYYCINYEIICLCKLKTQYVLCWHCRVSLSLKTSFLVVVGEKLCRCTCTWTVKKRTWGPVLHYWRFAAFECCKDPTKLHSIFWQCGNCQLPKSYRLLDWLLLYPCQICKVAGVGIWIITSSRLDLSRSNKFFKIQWISLLTIMSSECGLTKR